MAVPAGEKAITLQASASLSWLFTESAFGLGSAIEKGALNYRESFTHGETADSPVVNRVFHESRTISGTGDHDYDLTAITTNTLFANGTYTNSVSVGIEMLKGVFISRTDSDPVATLYINGDTGDSSAIVTPWNGHTSTEVHVEPSSCVLLTNRLEGWAVTATSADILRVSSTNTSSVSYKIVIWGCQLE